MRRGIRLKDIKVVNKPNGRRYTYLRVSGGFVRLPDLPENHPDFIAAVAAARSAKPTSSTKRIAAGTIAALCSDYLISDQFKQLAPATRDMRRRIITKVQDERGIGMVKDLQPRHLRKDLALLDAGPANNRLKIWRALLGYAVERGQIDEDPSIHIKPRKTRPIPHRRWQPEHIAMFRAHWPIGSAQRLAFELLYWTGARASDAVRLGRQMIDSDGWISFNQQKTGGAVSIPFSATLPSWAASFADDQKALLACVDLQASMIFNITTHGKPRSAKAFSQWISAAASQAGLPVDLTAHGLRKTRAALLAEAHATTHQVASWTGHRSLSEVDHYTREADRRVVLLGTSRKR